MSDKKNLPAPPAGANDEAPESLIESSLAFSPAQAEAMMRNILRVREIINDAMDTFLIKDIHYGVIPGTKKPALFQAGALALASLFCIRLDFPKMERIDHPNNHREYICQCVAYTRNGNVKLATAMGSCSTMESKYAERIADRLCPECGQPTVFQDKERGTFYCWAKKGGCGAKFAANDSDIIDQPRGKIPNPHLQDTYNTVLKMAEKRALVAVMLRALACSDKFTQDEELIQPDDSAAYAEGGKRAEAKKPYRRQPGPSGAPEANNPNSSPSALPEGRQEASRALPEPPPDRHMHEILEKLKLQPEAGPAVAEYLEMVAKKFADKNLTIQDVRNRAWSNPEAFRAKFDEFMAERKRQSAIGQGNGQEHGQALGQGNGNGKAQNGGQAASQGPPQAPPEIEYQPAPPDDPKVDPDDVKDFCMRNGGNFQALAEEFTATPFRNWDDQLWTSFARHLGMI